MVRLECRAPLRIDLAGGWSDIPPFARREGGAVLNVAISRYVVGEVRHDAGDSGDSLRISYGLDLPSGAGLGSSAALSVAWLALVHANMGHQPDQQTLAREACELASLLGLLGGKQDEYAAALGGVHLMRFGADVAIEPLQLEMETRRELEQRLVLCYSGQARLSGDIHDRVWGAYERGDAGVGHTLGDLRDVALAMAEALTRGDFEAVAEQMRRNWAAQQRLHPSITNDHVDRLMRIAGEAGAQGGKACGAGGGGCLVFLVEPRRVGSVRDALQQSGAQVIDARIDWDGVVITQHQ